MGDKHLGYSVLSWCGMGLIDYCIIGRRIDGKLSSKVEG